MTKFFRFELRTTNADGAREFYARVLGHDRAIIWPLHEQALARGARPHWLGSLGADDVERTATAFVERGATRFGPTVPRRDGGQMAILRDPSGAMVAVATSPAENAQVFTEVGWHVLNTKDAPHAAMDYRDLFGWEFRECVDLGVHGVFQHFAWCAGGANVGAIADVAARHGVHPHWLFFFNVDAFDRSIAATRDAGGVVNEPSTLPSGQRVCVCEDPQGAAFALCERNPAS
jgi:predicted enzyme related to lactoylglutathione lyase